ncbi:DUF4870 domain-containing protein [Melissococcus plutonius]|uniref:Integral membrane protein n=2 Tax=Melissococcus plutonius TaxID=33970 RepID=F3YB50_MELPT|nr:DUF4870 domain-containing protein [Melissococcus plutonius]BAL61922.1 hypothetical protein MPD5_0672 [Melissococcus plutonius DAT561]AIM25840.1 hypothetical protein MEPL_c012290 [Melissococcus plutonius S1]KMT25408.1 hypothetical protein MEPL2_2c09760 [Melissococcus plutonius]KMT25448.1 hypothetical protein MEPL3_5c00110 [Melissococcus plutonius]KMT26312.1 hypothetical protein MEPL1_5c00790 [Melissococcus plutonius]
MKSSRILSSLCYLSILVVPLLFPIIVWLLSHRNSEVHYHASRAITLHLIPILLGVFTFLVIGFMGISKFTADTANMVLVILAIIMAVTSILLFIYNIYYGIKLLVS